MKKIIKRIKDNVAYTIIVLVALFSYVTFGLSLFNQWPIPLAISGLTMLFAFFATLIEPILKKQRIQVFDWVAMVLNFICFIVLLSIYITVIPDSDFRNTVLALSSASIGGILTLMGVGLSIKYTRIYKEDDRLEELKPHLFIISDTRWNTLAKDKKASAIVPVSEDQERNIETSYEYEYKLETIRIANSDSSISVLRGIYFDDEFVRFKYELPLTKDSYTTLFFESFIFGINHKIKNVSLLCEDILQNQYLVKLGFDVKKIHGKYLLLIQSAYNAELLK